MIGRLGTPLLLSAGDGPQLLWTNNTGVVVTANIRFCNQNVGDDGVSVAISTAAGPTPTAAEYITRQHPCRGKRNYEDGGVRIDPGEKVFVSSILGNTSVRAWGA